MDLYDELIKKNYLLNLIFIFAILLTISLDYFLHIIYEGGYPVYWSIFLLLYPMSYIGLLQLDFYFKVRVYIFVFLLIKIYIFIFSLFDYNTSRLYMHFLVSDGGHYHIPSALGLYSFHDALDSLFSKSLNFNGRLTHVIIYIETKILSFFGFSADNYRNIALISFIFNTFLNLKTIEIFYKIAIKYFKNIYLARKSIVFIIFNPFILYYSELVQKEGLIFLAIAYLILYLIDKKVQNLLISSIIFLFERPYMLLLTFMIIFFLINIKKYYKFIIIFLFIGVIQFFLGIERALSMHTHYLLSMQNNTISLIGTNDILSNILRIIFAPAFFRPLLTSSINDNIFYFTYYFLIPFYSLLIVTSFGRLKEMSARLIIIGLVFVYFVAPFHGVLKLTILTFLFIFLVDKMKFFKLFRKENI